MKKFNMYITALLLSFFVSSGAQALTVSFQSLLNGGSITAGDKLFSDFRVIDLTVLGDNILAPDYDLITVTALDDGGLDPGPGLQFDFNGQLQAQGDSFGYSELDLFFGFSVAVLDPGLKIKDVSLALTEGSVTNNGDNGFYVVEKVGDTAASVEDVTSPGSLANMDVNFDWLDPSLGGPGLSSNLSGSANFAPQSKIYVSKNILVWSDNPDAVASLDQMTQRFSQVPEPHTLLLMAVGLMGFTFSVKRRKSLYGE